MKILSFLHELTYPSLLIAFTTLKTTLVKAVYPDLRYVNLDAPENREAVRAIASASWARDVGAAILDEAQKEPSVFEKVKYAYDDGALFFSVLLHSWKWLGEWAAAGEAGW